jgi:transcriptional regulator with XRE-family HTH domain
MSMLAAGTYIRMLREAKQLSRADLAKQSETNEMQIFRVEKGEIDTRGSLLMKILRVVEGSAEHIADLMLNEDATAEDGKRVAQERIRMTKNQGENSGSPYVPTTALGAFLHGLRAIDIQNYQDMDPEDINHYDDDYHPRDISDFYIRKVDRHEISMTEIALLLFKLKIEKEEINFLVDYPDLPPGVGDRLALTYLGIGSAEEIMRNALAATSSKEA